MRTIVLVSGLQGLATAYYLAEKGYEVTVIDENKQDSLTHCFYGKKLAKEVIRLQLQEVMVKKGVQFKYGCKVDKLIKQGNRIRCIKLLEQHGLVTLYADYFVIALDKEALSKWSKFIKVKEHLINKLNHYYAPMLGRGIYTNLFVNIENKNSSATVASHIGKKLADYIYDPASSNTALSVFQKLKKQIRLVFTKVQLFKIDFQAV